MCNYQHILLITYLLSITLSTLQLYFATNIGLINLKAILQIQQISLEKVRISQMKHHLARKKLKFLFALDINSKALN